MCIRMTIVAMIIKIIMLLIVTTMRTTNNKYQCYTRQINRDTRS